MNRTAGGVKVLIATMRREPRTKFRVLLHLPLKRVAHSLIVKRVSVTIYCTRCWRIILLCFIEFMKNQIKRGWDESI